MLAKNASIFTMEPGNLNFKKHANRFILSANIYWGSTLFQGYSGITQIHVLLISSGDSCVLTPRAEEERDRKQIFSMCCNCKCCARKYIGAIGADI